jgi:hypothetical protein
MVCAAPGRLRYDALDMTRKLLPAYVADPLQGFLDYWKESTDLLHATMRGISTLRAMPKIQAILMKVKDSQESEEENKKLAQTKDVAEFAKRECELGFPLMHAHTVVGCWGAIETTVEDVVVGILMNEPEVLRSDTFSRIRIPLAEFEVLDKEQRMRVLITELSRNSAGGRKQGLAGFEAILASVHLDGAVDETIKKTIWEMHHVRNVIVHRGSLADKRLVDNCPWMDLKIAKKVTVSHQMLAQYGEALARYIVLLLKRACGRYGIDFEEIYPTDTVIADTP